MRDFAVRVFEASQGNAEAVTGRRQSRRARATAPGVGSQARSWALLGYVRRGHGRAHSRRTAAMPPDAIRYGPFFRMPKKQRAPHIEHFSRLRKNKGHPISSIFQDAEKYKRFLPEREKYKRFFTFSVVTLVTLVTLFPGIDANARIRIYA